MTAGSISETEPGKMPQYTYFMISVAGKYRMMGTLERPSEQKADTTARTSKVQEISGVSPADVVSAGDTPLM
jgi:uncharacterized protein YunC (DUF1805 family)